MDVAAVIFGASLPARFVVRAAVGARAINAASRFAEWSPTVFYGFAAARLRGKGRPAALLPAAVVALIGGFLIAPNALRH